MYGESGGRAGPVAEVTFAAALGVALTHRFRRHVLDRGWLSMELRALMPRAAVAPVLIAALFVAPLAFIERVVLGQREGSLALVAVFALLRWTMVFAVWESIYLGVGLVRERRRSEIHRLEMARALEAARLRALESQLNPHFLFNALNTVRALIAEDPARAQAAVTQVASILRHALGSGREPLVPFESEKAVVDDYLAIESLRLGDRLRVEMQIEPASAGALVPPMLLQTLVENAVKHGIAELRNGGTLSIQARMENGTMLLTVDNPTPSPKERTRSMEAGNGIGLANATERLRLLFGDGARLEIDLSQPRRATARVRVPQRP
jgi:LytS/YehU family sensor histidine kinase